MSSHRQRLPKQHIAIPPLLWATGSTRQTDGHLVFWVLLAGMHKPQLAKFPFGSITPPCSAGAELLPFFPSLPRQGFA
ncbi:unnamed protein product [Ectocarpus sp. CCAP 1310/34]|nr:unnamed protein product [Ectocarpus sp. CCAP 1310/34]